MDDDDRFSKRCTARSWRGSLGRCADALDNWPHVLPFLSRTGVPKDTTKGQLLEAKAGIERMLEQLDLTDDERAALEGDRDAVPTPAGPTPEELGNEPVMVSLGPTQHRSSPEATP